MKSQLALTLLSLFLLFMFGTQNAQANESSNQNAPARPNILWLVIDDMGPDFSCYAEKAIKTPNIDRLANEGTLFTNAFMTAPVCSPARSSMITGMYQTSIGAHHHQSGRGKRKIHLPAPIVPIPALFQQAGYTCSNESYPLRPGKGPSSGKADYNFEWDRKIYDGPGFPNKNGKAPFFAQLQLFGGKYRGSQIESKWASEIVPEKMKTSTNPESVTLPPYYPRDPVILKDWANYLDTIRYTDLLVGEIYQQLEEAQLLDNTIIILFGDNGISHARGKQFLYDEGIKTPIIIRGPGIESGAVRDDLIEHIDLAATSLGFADATIPEWMQGDDIYASDYANKEAVFAARDRCGETVDMIRSVRTKQYKYIRNFFPDRPLLQPTNYKDSKAILIRLRELHQAGKLTAMQAELLFSPTRTPEELYDIQADPYETKNLANDPQHKKQLLNLRNRLIKWMQETNDQKTESPEEYDQEMQYQIDRNKRRPESYQKVKQNVELMKRWWTERPLMLEISTEPK